MTKISRSYNWYGAIGVSPWMPTCSCAMCFPTPRISWRWGADSVTDTDAGNSPRLEHHLTGQELCEALRIFALNQFGLMSPVVLKNWGISSTGDFGEIVYNMIEAGLMKKSHGDRRCHFDDVYDFNTAFDDDFKFCRLNLKI